jgi:hypothetical protein
LLNIDGLLRARLEIRNATLRLAKGHGALGRDLLVYQTNSQITGSFDTYHSFAFFNINLVANNDLR